MCEESSRRDFLRASCTPLMFSVLGMQAAGCQEKQIVEGAPAEAVVVEGDRIVLDLTFEETQPLTQEGQALIIDKAFAPIDTADTVVVNVDGETIRAFNGVCPH